MDIPEMMESTLFRLPACDHRRMVSKLNSSENQSLTFSSASNLMVQTYDFYILSILTFYDFVKLF